MKYKLITSCRECQGRVYVEDQNTEPANGGNLCELPPSPLHFRSFLPVIILQNFIAYPIRVLKLHSNSESDKCLPGKRKLKRKPLNTFVSNWLLWVRQEEIKKKNKDTFGFSHYQEFHRQVAWLFMAHCQIFPLCLPAGRKNNIFL